ncbi:tetratricopeptide repeat protein [Rhodanobacter sp. L36]|uniref:tetratricopeptide repeat protein n=1 Tax=Rhodanobacter sp. L36 TaxID=1747221 RepID=UPI00131BF76B|nr:tetratricopeptide repeat protein [Rhodanobacter sp. L36]
MGAFNSLLVELRRRHVYRVAVVYAAIGWLLVQIVTQVFPVFSFPAWTEQFAVLALLGGFPIALILAWAYEMRPDGVHRDDDSAVHESGRKRGHRVDVAIGILVLATLGVGVAMWSSHRASATHAVAATPAPATAPPIETNAKSIAVLPFENLSDEHANAYFAIGMQEQIRAQLTRLSGLRIISGDSTQKYQSHPDGLSAIARELNVNIVLEGSVQKSGDEARISLQLIDVNTNATLWAETYDRNLSHIFTVESEVAAQVAGALQVRLLPKEQQHLDVAPTHNPHAYDALLKGEAAQQRAEVSWQKADIDAAIAAFQQATTDDPQFALAYARLGYAYVWTVEFLADVDMPSLLEHSRQAFSRALALDPDSTEAHVAAGFYHFWAEEDDAAAAEQFKEALALNPQNAEAQLALGKIQHDLGHLDDSNIALQRAIELDPRNVLSWQALAELQQEKRQYAQADQSLLKAVQINPEAGLTWGLRSRLAYMVSGDGATMYAMVLSAPVTVQANPTHLVDRAVSRYRMHDYVQALKLIKTSHGSVHPPDWLCGMQADIEWAAHDRDLAKTDYLRCVDLILADAGHANDPWQSLHLGWFYARLGRAADAEREGLHAVDLKPIATSWNDGGYVQLSMAAIWSQLGKPDKAVPLLDQLLSTDHGNTLTAAMLRTEIEWDPIRNDPAFRQLLQRYGAPMH